MNPKTANLINSISLIFMGVWGFIDVSSPTALIPTMFGVLILICFFLSNINEKMNRIFVHVAIVLTLLILFALIFKIFCFFIFFFLFLKIISFS